MFDNRSNNNQDHVAQFQHEDKKKLQLVILLQLGVIIALVFLIITDWKAKPKPVYFIENNLQQLIDPVPLNQASMSNAAIFNWFTRSVMATFSFNYKNKDIRFEKLKEFYTPNGLKNLQTAINNNASLSTVVPKKQIVSMRVLESPEFLQDGPVNGVYTWNIKMPILLRMQNQVIRDAINIDIEAIVIRVPEILSPNGILIDDIVIKD